MSRKFVFFLDLIFYILDSFFANVFKKIFDPHLNVALGSFVKLG